MSSIYNVLLKKTNSLMKKGLYLIGDSAYALRSFLITPFDNAAHSTPEDNFNFHHSSARIYVECAFSEIDQQWGIFWKLLQFSLQHNVKVIDPALHLHNFIIDFWESHSVCDDDTNEKVLFEQECLTYLTANPEALVGIYGREEESLQDRRGHPSREESTSRTMGQIWQNKLCDTLNARGLICPLANWFCNSRTNCTDII